MKPKHEPAYYTDPITGERKPERRTGVDRRSQRPSREMAERRRAFRRQADRERYETDHKRMIEEALEDFAEEHGGRL